MLRRVEVATGRVQPPELALILAQPRGRWRAPIRIPRSGLRAQISSSR